MKNKLSKLGLLFFLIFSMDGCGVENNTKYETEYIKTASFDFHFNNKNKEFYVIAENIDEKYFKYLLESPSKEILISREIPKKVKQTLVCKPYSNEDNFITYDCIINSSNKDEPESISLVIEKGLKYNFYTIYDRNEIYYNDISKGEIFIPK